ncbi:glycoside hydrolase family 3 protein, partial [Bacillus subtilis]|uniref:glycoside hydrolase family 3 protein n=2 Tax=Bacillales TaxID=1385 RepID=UPI003F7B8635
HQGQWVLSPTPEQTDEDLSSSGHPEAIVETQQPAVFKLDVVANGIEQAKEAAQNSDVSVVVVGNSPYINGKEEIDRLSLLLPSDQVRLVKEVCHVNPNTVVVIVGSYPFALQDLKDVAPAIVY